MKMENERINKILAGFKTAVEKREIADREDGTHMRIVKLSKESKENLLADLLKRDPNNYGQYADTVQAIVDDVKARGDEALFEYTEKFDKVKVTKDTIRVTKEEIDEALKQVDPKADGSNGKIYEEYPRIP